MTQRELLEEMGDAMLAVAEGITMHPEAKCLCGGTKGQHAAGVGACVGQCSCKAFEEDPESIAGRVFHSALNKFRTWRRERTEHVEG